MKHYKVPISYYKSIKEVNGTPHLSSLAARVHAVNLEYVSDREGFSRMAAMLKGSTQLDNALRYYKRINYDWKKAVERITFSDRNSRTRLRLMRDRLKRKVEEWSVDPTLGDKNNLVEWYDRIVQWAEQLDNPVLSRYELKNANKYAANQQIRSFEGYFKQARDNYIEERASFRDAPLPRMKAYDLALARQYEDFHSPEDRYAKLRQYTDAMNSTQRNTFGGSPFYVAMDTFLDPDGDDDVTYVQVYDFYSTIYALLPPRFKVMVAGFFQYSPLERIQHGGIKDSNVLDRHEPTKQRIIQAESAVISHASKQFHDVMLDTWMERFPISSADKVSEEQVSRRMVEIYDVGHEMYQRTRRPVYLVGADWSNYDANMSETLLNDAYYNALRMQLPKWYNYWIIDPYFTVSFNTPTFIPGLGRIVTTGIKSGQQVTNQADTIVANFVDYYELYTYQNLHDYSDSDVRAFFIYRLNNGDDRYKIAPFGAEHIEKADAQLCLIAQKAKQEIYQYGVTDQLQVTYLKTVIFETSQGLIRTSSEAADILGRFTRERVRIDPMPASVVLESIMAGNRLEQHPDIGPLIEFINSIEVGRKWINREITTQQLLALAAREQMEEMMKQKGKRWLERMNIDMEGALQRLYSRYGMVPGSYNLPKDYRLESGRLNFEKLPMVRRILSETERS